MSKAKIAISLSERLLGEVDVLVSSSQYASRSQAIESLLVSAISSRKVSDAVLLVAARHVPVCLRQVEGTPLILRQLSLLAHAGISRTIILVQEGADTLPIVEAVNAAKLGGVVVKEVPSRGNAHALFLAQGLLYSSFFAMSGDIFADFSLAAMLARHVESGAMATVGLTTSRTPSKMGMALVEGDVVVDFIEKPSRESSLVVNAGCYVFSTQIFPFLERATSLERDVLPAVAKLGQLHAFFFKEKVQHFG